MARGRGHWCGYQPRHALFFKRGCAASASSDFFTSVGGGVGVCSYAGVSVGTVVRVVDSSFSHCSADYGEVSARPAHADVFLLTRSALKGGGKEW